jgi:hypothetical protein
MKVKFPGTYEELQDRVLLTGVFGKWSDLGNQKQYRTDDGAVLNWWESSKTITFQGATPAARKLEAMFFGTSSAGQATLSAVASEAGHLRVLQEENAMLKKLLGEAMIKIAMLKKRAG